jgi:hypothetical protein
LTKDGKWGGLKISPILIDLRTPGETVRRKQYSISLEGKLGLKPIVEELLRDDLLESCISPFNTSILLVRKSDGS